MNLRNFFRSLTAIPLGAVCLIMFTSLLMMIEVKAQGAAPTPPSTNPIPAENAKTGTLDWRIQPLRRSTAAGRETEGYASHTSVNVGEQITFYVSTSTPQPVNIEIYRMGWYDGLGGRLITTLTNLPVTPQDLDEADHTTGLIECNWDVTTSWTPPASSLERAVSGFYLAKIVGKPGVTVNPGKDSTSFLS